MTSYSCVYSSLFSNKNYVFLWMYMSSEGRQKEGGKLLQLQETTDQVLMCRSTVVHA